MEGEIILSTSKLKLDLPPSCIKFIPLHREYCIIGTYFLQPQKQNPEEESKHEGGEAEEQKRNGSLLLVKIVEDHLVLISTLATDFAILDLLFDHTALKNKFCTANSTGSIGFYEIILEDTVPTRIRQVSLCQLWDPSVLVLSLSSQNQTGARLLGVTLSNSEVAVCRVNEEFTEASFPLTIASHEGLEAWVTAFGHHTDNQTLFSGGDDAALQMITLPETTLADRHEDQSEDTPSAVVAWKNRKIHGAGVTAILVLSESLLLTGSYDDHVRLIDISSRPMIPAQTHLGGGVWRLIPLEPIDRMKDGASTTFTLLACCMHAGSRIIRVTTTDPAGIEILARFEENESMNYGGDVQESLDGIESDEHTIVSISFYDKMAFLWKAP
ncbi:hypothetical protein EJ08DRAFT_685063 [Tothia fuscella]|uniref:Uncharacterized protein n=1 Tax=Tothia fuscella TaxID=1048955 RepID=A0A9P4P0Y7_9PEZI|nr:hypothetical protein EJ08DRAFT_685063 [Tothia fuscella]